MDQGSDSGYFLTPDVGIKAKLRAAHSLLEPAKSFTAMSVRKSDKRIMAERGLTGRRHLKAS